LGKVVGGDVGGVGCSADDAMKIGSSPPLHPKNSWFLNYNLNQ